MEPIGIVTALMAALYIVGRGPRVVAPTATAAFYRRLFSTPGRLRMVGVLLIPLAAALIVTARQARGAQGNITILIEGFGWFAAVAALWPIATPGFLQRCIFHFYSTPDEFLRTFGALNVVFGLFWGLVAFSVR